jgi:hypothetical protein
MAHSGLSIGVDDPFYPLCHRPCCAHHQVIAALRVGRVQPSHDVGTHPPQHPAAERMGGPAQVGSPMPAMAGTPVQADEQSRPPGWVGTAADEKYAGARE